MKCFLKIFFVLGLAIAICCSIAIAEDKNNDKAMKDCIKKDIEETSVTIGGYYSDPGGLKKKAAQERCEYEKSKSTKKFENKYGTKANQK